MHKLNTVPDSSLAAALLTTDVLMLPAFDGVPVTNAQVWSLTQFYSIDFSQSRIGVKKCYSKRTIKVCVSCCDGVLEPLCLARHT